MINDKIREEIEKGDPYDQIREAKGKERSLRSSWTLFGISPKKVGRTSAANGKNTGRLTNQRGETEQLTQARR